VSVHPASTGTRPLKICDLTQFYSPASGGVRRYIEQKGAYLRKHRPDCQHIVIVPGEKTESTGDERIRVYTIASPLLSRTSRYRALTKLHLIEEVLEKERPDIIESGDPYQVAWKAIASGCGLDIPVVGFYHSHFPEAYFRTIAKYFGPLAISITDEICRKYVVTLYNHFERTFVPSPVLGRLLAGWGVENLHTVDLGVDAEVFVPDIDDRAATREKLGIPAEVRLLLYVGRLAPEKNVRTLFEAFALLHDREPGQYRLLCVGDGTQRSLVKNLEEETRAVHWLPFCPDAHELAALYRAADVFVHPGVQETFGLVALESQASGTPVVGIKGSYMDRIIFTDQKQWATENTPAALAEAIERKFTQDLRAAGRQASAEARARYSWNSVFARLLDIYTDVVNRYSP
jgi:alpha-1,6-mannosyltransferase